MVESLPKNYFKGTELLKGSNLEDYISQSKNYVKKDAKPPWVLGGFNHSNAILFTFTKDMCQEIIDDYEKGFKKFKKPLRDAGRYGTEKDQDNSIKIKSGNSLSERTDSLYTKYQGEISEVLNLGYETLYDVFIHYSKKQPKVVGVGKKVEDSLDRVIFLGFGKD